MHASRRMLTSYPLGRCAGALALVLAVYMLLFRPLMLHWGATANEIARTLPGDDLALNPSFDATARRDHRRVA